MSRITTCPHCSSRLSLSERITDKTLICPHCLADLDNPWPGSQIRAADISTDVKRDVNVGSIVVAVLMGICLLGIIMPSENKEFSGLFISGAALLVLVCFAIIRGRDRRDNSRRRDRRDNSGGTAGFVFTVGIVFLVIGTLVAIAIFGFFCCAASVNESLRHMH
jgi:hypothetical protein